VNTLGAGRKCHHGASRRLRGLFCAVLLTLACAGPVYVRPYQPTTRADSLAVHADSVAWAADLKAKRTERTVINLVVYVCLMAVLWPLVASASR
jgi:hypothetical protein